MTKGPESHGYRYLQFFVNIIDLIPSGCVPRRVSRSTVRIICTVFQRRDWPDAEARRLAAIVGLGCRPDESRHGSRAARKLQLASWQTDTKCEKRKSEPSATALRRITTRLASSTCSAPGQRVPQKEA